MLLAEVAGDPIRQESSEIPPGVAIKRNDSWLIHRPFRIDPVDSAMLFITKRRDISIPLSSLGIVVGRLLRRRRVVLDNNVIPITNPESSVRPHFSRHRPRPSVGRIIDVVWELPRFESRAIGSDMELPH